MGVILRVYPFRYINYHPNNLTHLKKDLYNQLKNLHE